jgi:uncharacterized membrane protein
LIIGGIIIANVPIFALTTAVHPPQHLDFYYWFAVLTYWPMLLALPFAKSDKLDIALLLILIGGYLANVLLPNWIL